MNLINKILLESGIGHIFLPRRVEERPEYSSEQKNTLLWASKQIKKYFDSIEVYPKILVDYSAHEESDYLLLNFPQFELGNKFIFYLKSNNTLEVYIEGLDHQFFHIKNHQDTTGRIYRLVLEYYEECKKYY